ncbi:hypothetical protein OHC33_001013 [Knufia fluminis]|uniref:RNase H type-1 domain-containing protein n=1 Tax=Knufia fluminis TaxID=191047 RepID=A0AAN8EKE6_9EURO|nr:hypothetical protein OHC33_001013 [Knufia fluminis]
MAQPLPNMTSNNQQFQPQYRPREGPVRRTFIPQRSRRYGNPTFPIKKLVKYSPKYGYSRLFNFPFSGSNWRPRMNTIVIQIQGLANPNSSTDPNSAAAAGVYFGANSPHNINFTLPPYMQQTSNRALLEATLIALKETIAMRQTILDPRWKEIIIMTNSDYVKQSLTRWIWTWERNGWNHMKQQNNPIAHIRTMEELQNIMTYIETTCNMTVRFWKVSREDIAGADGQAQVAMQLKRNNDVANAFAMMGI